MARFLVLWELDQSRIPEDPAKKKEAWLAAIAEINKDMKSGKVKEWGGFLNGAGFTVNEGTEEEIYALLLKYIPMCRFTVQPFISVSQAEKSIKALG
ncbi:MAG TPA: hypothetical protein VM658_01345 [bacterium]|nr:hypothetical protein [bacterium]